MFVSLMMVWGEARDIHFQRANACDTIVLQVCTGWTILSFTGRGWLALGSSFFPSRRRPCARFPGSTDAPSPGRAFFFPTSPRPFSSAVGTLFPLPPGVHPLQTERPTPSSAAGTRRQEGHPHCRRSTSLLPRTALTPVPGAPTSRGQHGRASPAYIAHLTRWSSRLENTSNFY